MSEVAGWTVVRRWRERLVRRVGRWLATDVQPRPAPRTDFDRLSEHLQPADVVLVEGRSRVAGVIQSVTLSSWSHAALYIGRAGALVDAEVRRVVARGGWPAETHMLLEAEMGAGCACRRCTVIAANICGSVGRAI